MQVVRHTDAAAVFVKGRYDPMEGISSFRKVVEEGPSAVKTLLARDATSGTLKSPTWVHILIEDEKDRSLDRFVLRDYAPHSQPQCEVSGLSTGCCTCCTCCTASGSSRHRGADRGVCRRPA